jgi:hypothetical protein
MLDIVSAPSIVRVVCSAYLLSICLLLSLSSCGWWVISYLERLDTHRLPN